MMEYTMTVASSLEARPAAIFVQTASKFASHIDVRIDNKTVNAKSIMGMISLGILDGQIVTLIADGADEKQAIEELKNCLTAV